MASVLNEGILRWSLILRYNNSPPGGDNQFYKAENPLLACVKKKVFNFPWAVLKKTNLKLVIFMLTSNRSLLEIIWELSCIKCPVLRETTHSVIDKSSLLLWGVFCYSYFYSIVLLANTNCIRKQRFFIFLPVSLYI